ncbi:hypothetical protein ABPG75_005411 [Micractinium tetrahymenae]
MVPAAPCAARKVAPAPSRGLAAPLFARSTLNGSKWRATEVVPRSHSQQHQQPHVAAAGAAPPASAARSHPGAQLNSAVAAPSLRPSTSQPFPWLHSWYPVGVPGNLPKNRPTKITLFGRQLVVWWDAAAQPAGRWRCFENLCPHRLAPLSEGRIDGAGRLQCSLHGWAFDGRGRCTSVPQVVDATHTCASRRACAAAFPTAEAHGLIFVWPDASPGAAAQAAATPLPIPPELLEADSSGQARYEHAGGGWFVKLMPHDFTTTLENFVDPAHAPFAHHGTAIGTREEALPFELEVEGKVTLDGGFRACFTAPTRHMGVRQGGIAFQPPCCMVNSFTLGSGQAMLLVGYMVPASPGRTWLVRATFAERQAGAGLADAAARTLRRCVPRWLAHLSLHDILDGDAVLLHGQERHLEQAPNGWRSCFMATSADGAVLALRRWLDLAGGAAGVPWAGGSAALPPAEPSKRLLLDRLHSHTEHCPACSGALCALRTTRTAGVVAAVGATAAAAWLPAGCPLEPAAAAAAASGALLAAAAHWAVPNFVFKDFSHPDSH